MTRKLKKALTRLVDAAKHLNIEPTIFETWEFPLETTLAHLTFRMDNGSSKSFLALRWRHDDSLGPTKDRAQRSKTNGLRGISSVVKQSRKQYCDLPSAADTRCRKADKAVALGPLAKADWSEIPKVISAPSAWHDEC
ncbi:hypothetical protein [Rhizobium leguminosarum]|uniref:hypothetical protein n=1 Tax=Rhizobium leguminosarum TaxID=384 RepID=UPI001C97F550|nr:hypothetical protein [Rhizobium leguminosarum]